MRRQRHISVRMTNLVLLVPIFIKLSAAQELTCIADIKTLSELPLNRLLVVKKTFEIEQETAKKPNEENLSAPKALALQANKQNINRGSYGASYGAHVEDSNSKKSGGKKSVQSIFQISVTTLAFLAFGGYLLCLIVQAIKGKHNYNTMDTNQLMAYLARPTTRRPVRRRTTVRRRRPTRRRRRPTRRPPRSKKSKKKYTIRTKREAAWTDVHSEDMYRTLTMLAESYTHYHTTDYRHYNYTVKHY